MLAWNKIIPSKEWYHDCDLYNSRGLTVNMLLKKNNIDVPKEWKHSSIIDYLEDYCFDNGIDTIAIINNHNWNNNKNRITFAMYLAWNK